MGKHKEEPKVNKNNFLAKDGKEFDKGLDDIFNSSAGPSVINHDNQIKKAKDAFKNLKTDNNKDADKKENDDSNGDGNESELDDEELKDYAEAVGVDVNEMDGLNDVEDDNDIEENSQKSKKTSTSRIYKIEGETPEQKHERTVFVGNVPTEVAKNKSLSKQLVRHLMSVSELPVTAKYDSIRFRSVAFSVPTSASTKSQNESNMTGNKRKRYLTPQEKRKVAFIKQDFHPDSASVNAYVVFGYRRPNDVTLLNNKDKDIHPSKVAQIVIDKANGSVFQNRVLRVDSVIRKDKSDTGRWHIDKELAKRTLFVGRLDFAQNEKELEDFIETLLKEEKGVRSDGEKYVKGVRIVRDPETQLGKGFGYVHLIDNDCVQEMLVLPQDKLKLNKRTLRLSKSKASGKTKPQDDLKLDNEQQPKKKQKVTEKDSNKKVKGDPNLGEKLEKMSKEDRKKFKSVDSNRQSRRIAKKQELINKKVTDAKVTGKSRKRSNVKDKHTSNVKKPKKKKVLSEKALSKHNQKK